MEKRKPANLGDGRLLGLAAGRGILRGSATGPGVRSKRSPNPRESVAESKAPQKAQHGEQEQIYAVLRVDHHGSKSGYGQLQTPKRRHKNFYPGGIRVVTIAKARAERIHEAHETDKEGECKIACGKTQRLFMHNFHWPVCVVMLVQPAHRTILLSRSVHRATMGTPCHSAPLLSIDRDRVAWGVWHSHRQRATTSEKTRTMTILFFI